MRSDNPGRSDVRQRLTARRLGWLQADNAQCRIGAAHLDRDHPDTNSHIEEARSGRIEALNQASKSRHTLAGERPRSRPARIALRVQQLRVRVHPPGYKRVPHGPINQVPALPERRAQLGAQLRNPLIGQDLPHPVNSDVRVIIPPRNPDSDQDIQHPLRQLGGHSSCLGGLVEPHRSAKSGEQTRLDARGQHGQAPGRLGKRFKL
jgi:hypothetical protein